MKIHQSRRVQLRRKPMPEDLGKSTLVVAEALLGLVVHTADDRAGVEHCGVARAY